MKEVASDIFMITEPAGYFGIRDSVNIFIIAEKNGIVIDSGYPDRKSLKKFDRAFSSIKKIYQDKDIPFNINRILLTHAHQDHFAGLHALRQKYGFQIMATESMAQYIKSMKHYRNSYTEKNNKYDSLSLHKKALHFFNTSVQSFLFRKIFSIQFVSQIDITLSSDDAIDINGETWKIFHSPGHSDDHISLYNRERGILFSGDNVLKKIATWLGPPRSNLDDYIQTLETYRQLPGLKLILPAHGDIITNPIERIDELIEWRKKRTDDILKLIESDGPISRKDIMRQMYPSEKMKRYLGGGWIALTLSDLEKKGLIVSYKEKEKSLYQIKG